MDEKYFYTLRGMEAEEFMLLQLATKDMTEDQFKKFAMFYQSRRKEPQMILGVTIIGFIGFAGIQRFMTEQIGMGILYLLTLGFCYVGTIMDTINYKKIALEYNHRMMFETLRFIKMMGS